MRKIICYLIAALFLYTTAAYAVSGYPQKGVVVNQTLTTSGTEYQVTMPDGTSGFTAQSRTAADFKIGMVSNESGTNYFTVKSGSVYSTPTTLGLGDTTPNTTLFLQSGNAGQIVEILYWR